MAIKKKELIEETEIDELGNEKEKSPKRKNNYVDNKRLHAAFLEWYELMEKNPKAQMPRYIAECIVAVSNHHAYSKQFIGYSRDWKEEMIGDAIEICCRYIHNFNPIKFKNPFAYMTQLVSNAFKQRIQKEKKQYYFKMKQLQTQSGAVLSHTNGVEEEFTLTEDNPIVQDANVYVAEYEEKHFVPKSERVKPEVKTILGDLIGV